MHIARERLLAGGGPGEGSTVTLLQREQETREHSSKLERDEKAKVKTEGQKMHFSRIFIHP